MSDRTQPTDRLPRLPRTLPIALGIVVLSAAYLLLAQKAAGVRYDEVADSTSNLRDMVLVPVGLGAVLLAALWSWLRWGRQVLVDSPAMRPRRIFWVPVLALVAMIVVQATQPDWGELSTGFIIVGLLGAAAVGFTEELLVRGLLLDGARAQHGEAYAFFFTSIVFGLLHGLNVLNGQDLDTTITQVLVTTLTGMSLYCARRVAGTLVFAMVLHALFDFVLLMQGTSHTESGSAVASPDQVIAAIATYAGWISLIVVIVLLVRRRDRRVHVAG